MVDFLTPINAYRQAEQFKQQQSTNALANMMNAVKLQQLQQEEADRQSLRQASQGAFNQQTGEFDFSKIMPSVLNTGNIEGALKLRDLSRQTEEKKALQDVLSGRSQQPSVQQQPQQLPGSMPQPQSQQASPLPLGDSAKQVTAYQKYMRAADDLMTRGMVAPAKQLYDLAKEARPELKDQKVLTDPNSGKRIVVNYYKDGTSEVQPFNPDLEKLHFADTGGRAAVGIDPFSGQQRTAGLQRTMTPGEMATSARAAEANKLKAQEINVLGGGRAFEAENKLRDEFNKQAEPFIKTRDAHARVLASAQDPSGAGDLSLLYNYMKMLDPGSTVMAGEYAQAANAGGIPDRIRAQYNKAINGEKLDESMRADFVDRSNRLYKQQESSFKQTNERYTKLATDYGLRSQNVTGDLTLKPSSQEKTTAAAGTTFSSLPDPRRYVGKTFVDDNGNRMTSNGSQWVRK